MNRILLAISLIISGTLAIPAQASNSRLAKQDAQHKSNAQNAPLAAEQKSITIAAWDEKCLTELMSKLRPKDLVAIVVGYLFDRRWLEYTIEQRILNQHDIPAWIKAPMYGINDASNRSFSVYPSENDNLNLCVAHEKDGRSTYPARTLSGHKDTITACAFSQDYKNIASFSKDGTLKVWHNVGAQPIDSPIVTDSVTLTDFVDKHVRSIHWSPHGDLLAIYAKPIFYKDTDIEAYGMKAYVLIVDIESRCCNMIRIQDNALVWRWSPDGKQLAGASQRGFCIWEPGTTKINSMSPNITQLAQHIQTASNITAGMSIMLLLATRYRKLPIAVLALSAASWLGSSRLAPYLANMYLLWKFGKRK